jgi:hypothetical protein
MVRPPQLTASKGKEMLDVIGVIFLLFVGGLSVLVIGALAIWIADTAYKRRMKRDRRTEQKATDSKGDAHGV